VKARRLRQFHAVATIVWLILVVPSVLWWKDSILWVILMSAWANVAGHFGAWQGARAEEAVNGDSRTADNPSQVVGRSAGHDQV